jgi:mRNA-degrading endonuclease RelE of RelBE toxin-antitoxin system
MAQIYVDDETKKKLDELAESEHRAINDEVSFLVDSRIFDLGKKNENE